MLILIAGPYRSGTGDDPARMAANLWMLEAPSYALFKAGHIPMIGEWVALPVWNAAGGEHVGDNLYEEIFHPVAHRLLAICDGVLRLQGRHHRRVVEAETGQLLGREFDDDLLVLGAEHFDLRDVGDVQEA